MVTIEIREIPNLDLKRAAARQRDAHEVALAGIEYRATRTPDFYNYPKMIEACCEAASPLLSRLFDQDYRLWLFLIGAPFDNGDRRRYVNYSLAKPARAAQIINENRLLEKIFEEEGDLQRTAGIYAIDRDNFGKSAQFVTNHFWALLILSASSDFMTVENLTKMYRAATTDIAPKALIAKNWDELSLIFCPRGDVVVKTHGAFDDLYRHVLFISMADILFN